ISYPIVMRYGLSRHNSVGIAVGGTIIADVLTLLVLAVVGGMFKEEATGWFWVRLVIEVILIGLAIIYTFPIICK
ncbi:MAG: cation:proton antiporter, partial [Bacteroidaceae bacterium]|nr:cation:proton antiporter [Bacteroidaceae bacterium]